MRRWWLTFTLVVGLQAQATDTLTVTFTGDVLLDRGVRVKISTDGVESLFSPSVDSLFAHSDVVVGNLECPVTDIRTPMQKMYIFRGDPECLPVLRQHGFTHLNMANNHTVDQGRRGLIDTRRRVADAGMGPIGAGATMDEAAQPVLLAEAPRKVWMVASLRLALENYAYLPSRPHAISWCLCTGAVRIPCIRCCSRWPMPIASSMLVPTFWLDTTRTLCRMSRYIMENTSSTA